MKISKNEIRLSGLSTVYEPDDLSETGLDIIFVHGLGGHPVRTWLHTRTIPPPAAAAAIDRPASTELTAAAAPPAANRRRNTLKKRHGAPAQQHDASPRRRPRSPFRRSLSADPSGPRRLSPVPAAAPPPSEGEAPKDHRPPKVRDTYWPRDLLPEACPNARVFTYGFHTLTVEGRLVPGQLDIFMRGRELLEAMGELNRSDGPRRKRREVVFVAHSTGGIIVKEMLRLASNFLDTDDEGLLASIAGIVFLGCPLRNTSYGSTAVAMKSIASALTQAPRNDEVLGELLGGDEAAHLTGLGCEAFESVWEKYNFRVKTYRETIVAPPLASWAEFELALRRDACSFENNREQAEDLEGDHVEMCRFGSARDAGYLSISSFVDRLACYQALKRRGLTEREKAWQQALADPSASAADPAPRHGKKAPTSTSVKSTANEMPHWLLSHPHFQSWFQRSDRENAHKVLWLSGPPGSQQSELSASLQSYITQQWAPETHSSAIVAITADEGRSILESVLFANLHGICAAPAHSIESPRSGDDRALPLEPSAHETSAPAEQHHHDAFPASTPTRRPTPATALRNILLQLYPHDPRLRNLVRKKANAAARSLPLYEPETPLNASLSQLVKVKVNARPAHDKLNSPKSNEGQAQFGDHTATGTAASSRKPAASPEQGGTRLSTTTSTRRWSDPTADTIDFLLSRTQAVESWWLIERGAEAANSRAGRTKPEPAALDDADVVSLFLEDYLCLDTVKERSRSRHSEWIEKRQSRVDEVKVEIPSARRVFILVDAVENCGGIYLRELLWCLSQLARRSDFSVCVATSEHATAMARDGGTLHARSRSAFSSTGLLPIIIPDYSADSIRAFIDSQLAEDMEERDAIVAKMSERSGGNKLWAEMVTTIANEASEDAVSGEIILSMLDNIAPTSRGRLDDLYAWKLSRLSLEEQAQALVVMQWVMLAPEPLRLNDLLVALRLTLLTRRRAGKKAWDVDTIFDVEPPMSLKDLRTGNDELGIGSSMDSPSPFWKYLQYISRGLLKLESAGGPDNSISNEPLGLKWVRPAHESVLQFFLQGRGFQSLLPLPGDPQARLPSTERIIENTYYTLLHACLRYLNMSDFEHLSGEKKAANAAPGEDLTGEETRKRRKQAEDQRRMIMSSYPFLRYVVDNLVVHLLCPRQFRYFLPQTQLLRLWSANRCRIWRRWTHLLGFGIRDADPDAILNKARQGVGKTLLAPVFGARYRLERVLRRVWKTAMEQHRDAAPPGRASTTPRRAHFRSLSDMSAGPMTFTLVGSDDPMKSQWLVPTSPQSRSSSSPATPRFPLLGAPAHPSPRALSGIQEAA